MDKYGPGDDLLMMQEPDEWPLSNVLPIKRTSPDGGTWPQCGFMVRGQGPKVFIGYIYDIENIDSMKVEQYDSFEDVIKDGWIVD